MEERRHQEQKEMKMSQCRRHPCSSSSSSHSFATAQEKLKRSKQKKTIFWLESRALLFSRPFLWRFGSLSSPSSFFCAIIRVQSTDMNQELDQSASKYMHGKSSPSPFLPFPFLFLFSFFSFSVILSLLSACYLRVFLQESLYLQALATEALAMAFPVFHFSWFDMYCRFEDKIRSL